MKKFIGFILIFLFCTLNCKRSDCTDDNVHNSIQGNWKLIEKRKGYTYVPLSSCDSLYNRITLYPNKASHWTYCTPSGNTYKRKIKYYNIGGPTYCEPRLKYYSVPFDDISTVSGGIGNGQLYINFRYKSNLDTIFTLRFEKY